MVGGCLEFKGRGEVGGGLSSFVFSSGGMFFPLSFSAKKILHLFGWTDWKRWQSAM